PNKFLVNDASLAIMPEGVRNDYNNSGGLYDFQYYSSSQGELTDRLIEYDALFTRDIFEVYNVQNDFLPAGAKANLLSAADLGLGVLEKSKTDKDALAGQIATFRNGLEGRIQVYLGGEPKNQISQDQLVGYVNQLRNFFVEKQTKGEEVNTAVLEALENTGAFTDEMAKLKFFQGL
ncbi:hypothetical protein CH373_18555, partial [Leptospira perolatii]